MITVVDYGMGNLGSVVKALNFLGQSVKVSSIPEDIEAADRLILPGVGAMTYAMEQLNSLGLTDAIKIFLTRERPFLGICLGMQLMFEKSEEGRADGIGYLKGQVRRFSGQPGLKIPHMGWNSLCGSRLPLLPTGTCYYFVHSYYVVPADRRIIAAECIHGQRFTAAVELDHILLTQFHPEKSGDAGIRMLEKWTES